MYLKLYTVYFDLHEGMIQVYISNTVNRSLKGLDPNSIKKPGNTSKNRYERKVTRIYFY